MSTWAISPNYVGKGSATFYEVRNKESGKLYTPNSYYFPLKNGACHGQSRCIIVKGHEGLMYFSLTPKREEEDMIKWCTFMTLCGFPCSYVGITSPSFYEQKFYCISLDLDKYISDLHVFIAITAIRMISYSYLKEYIEIAKTALQIKEKNQELDCFLCLMLAHSKICCDENVYEDEVEGHGLIGKTFKFTSTAEFLEELSKTNSNGINNFLRGDKKHFDFKINE